MRIAILCDALDFQYAGIRTYLRGLLTALPSADPKNEYLLVRAKPDGERVGDFPEIVVPLLGRLPGHRYLRAFTSLPRALVRAGVNAVVEPAHFGPFGLPPQVRRITIIHDLTPLLFPHFHPLPSVAAHRLLLPGILKRADRIIANSLHTQRDIEAFQPAAAGKVRVVLPGKDAMFRPVQDVSVLEKMGIRQPYLLCTGTLEPRKNLLSLLRAYEALRKRGGPALQLVLVGKAGWKMRPFFEALKTSPFRQDILLAGFVHREDLPALYAQCRLFIYPSWYEGFGLPVLEAMACGAPVLISNSSSLPEVGGNAAAYFNPESVNELTGQLLRLTTDVGLLAAMGKASLERSANFNWESAKGWLD